MTGLLVFSIAAIVSALVLYTIGVWSERLAGKLKPWHTLLFWAGLVFDTTGTTLMGSMAGRLEFNLHGVTGVLAIVLMFGHAIWAVVVLITKQDKAILNFHKFSTLVWLIWLVPFLSGMAGAMRG